MRSRGWAGTTPASDEEAISRILSAVDEEVERAPLAGEIERFVGGKGSGGDWHHATHGLHDAGLLIRLWS